MKKLLLGGVGACLLLVGAFAYRASASGARPDCPGKMICPITGEEICVDHCALGEKQTTDDIPACCTKNAKP